MLKHFIFIAFGFVFFGTNILLSSCEKDMAIALNNDNVDALNLASVDSLSVQITNLTLQHIPTSGAGAILLGRYDREGAGSVSVAPYFQVEPENYNYSDIPEDARFDSIKLVLRTHNQLHVQGDTTKLHTIRAHRITQRLETTRLQAGGINNVEIPFYVQTPAIFGDQNFQIEEAALGELSYTPRPGSRQRLAIRLNDAFGKDLFDKMQTDDARVVSAANFAEYMNGFAVIPDEENTSVIAYNDTIQAEIHYSYIGAGGLRTTAQRNLVIRDYSLKYNKFSADRSGTPFQGLSATTPLPGAATNGVGLVQAGTGAAVRIDFPALRNFLQTPGIAVNRMELEVEIQSNQNWMYPLPTGQEGPSLYLANSSGVALDFIRTPFTTDIQRGQFTPANNTGQNAKYRFNLIEYIRVVNSESIIPRSLVLAFPPALLVGTAHSFMIAAEDNTPKIKLNILYTKFN
ncbi:DUF4270 domain-containing protein [Sphingobacterium sp. lm-10]|uniref:DUF4270 family protein n=1 Tax=Sphingobacterium sp. lm-10 TaxID=2944904 RepID=UPI002020D8BF|nr:DUF4270 family protein [Sphingobacterium sp. lm-10]MCL7988547.1 DUF4270 domain-containing protein [Sphingobacterium sp. lm-10]